MFATAVATGMFLASLQSEHSAAEYAPSQTVGNLAGDFGVNGNGSATYGLAIEVPPGVAGVSPTLHLTYDSHRGDGYIGMGWALNGISAITRCGANYKLDGYKAGVAYDNRDRFCLDGRRLVSVSGAYGANGTVYHTEQETWTLLTSHGACGKGPCFFTATDKDGNELSFGATTGPSGSRIPAQGRSDGAIRTWSIDRFTDLNGNYSAVSYATFVNSGEYYPVRIDYTANDRTGLAAARSVRLIYDDRLLTVRRYLGGSEITVSKVLVGIETHVAVAGEDQTILNYRLAYEMSPSTNRSRLTSITLCDGASNCWPPTSFDWYTESKGFKPAKNKIPGPTYVILDQKLYVFGVLMDINGDGIADYSQATEFLSGSKPNSNLKIYLGQTDGSFKEASYTLPGPLYQATSEYVVKVGLLKDINGDGIIDYSHALKNEDAGTTDLTVWRGTSTGFVKDDAYQLPGQIYWQVNGQTMTSGILTDLNGDGIPDYSRATLLRSTGETLLDIYKGTGSGFEKLDKKLPGPLFAIDGTTSSAAGILRDMNGDGIADYSAATVNADSGSNDLKVYVGSSPDFGFESSFELPGQMLWIVNGVVLESGALVDINGDGIADYSRATVLESTGKTLLDVYLGTAQGYSDVAFKLPGPLYSILDNISYTQGLLTDWNGDGTARYSRATQWADGREELGVYLGNGTGFREAGYNLPKALFRVLDTGTYGNGIYQDINGDGLTDFVDGVCILEGDGSLSNCSLDIRLAEGPYSDLLRSVTNGFGGSTDIDYAPLTSNLYEMAAPAVYPIRNQSGAMYVVSAYTNNDGRGNAYSFSYHYTGAHSDVLGSGWLGFETIAMTDTASGRSSLVAYEQAYPFYGLVQYSETRSGAGALLTRGAFSYTDVASAPMRALGIHQPLRASETMTHYTDGAADYTLEKQYQYDGYGNVAIASDLGDITNADDDVFYCVRFINQPETGIFGYIAQDKASKTKDGCQVFVATADGNSIKWNPDTDLRWSKVSYDARMNRLSHGSYDNSHNIFISAHFGVDDYGNILSATDPAGNTTSYTYDSVYQTFLTKITSPELTQDGSKYWLVTQMVYEPGFGKLTSTTDANGNISTQEIDGFGRFTKVFGPDPTGAVTLLVTSNWRENDGAFYLETSQRPDWSNGDSQDWYWTRDYFDGLGRQYRTERNGLKNGQPKTIVSDLIFDAEGRVKKSSAAYYAGDDEPYTVTEYDVYNRPVLITDPSGVQEKLDYADGGWRVARTFAYGTPDARTTITYLNAQGQVHQSVEPNGLAKTYIYNKLGQLTSMTTKPEARASSLHYDSLGRVRQASNTNTGETIWDFDAVGYLRKITDASGNIIEFTVYDALGRLRSRQMSYAGETATVLFTYDQTSASNGLGNLTRVDMSQSPLGDWSYTYNYDAYHIANSGSAIIAGDQYNYASQHDPLGRVTNATYPNGMAMAASYRADQHLGTISLKETPRAQAQNYASYTAFTALGQVITSEFGPMRMNETIDYYPLGPSYAQLKSITVISDDAPSAPLINRSYGWNNLLELVSITDLVDPDRSEKYGYDGQQTNLHMGFITNASGRYGPLDYAYDQVGNLSEKAGITFDYVDGKDQIASSSDGDSFAYQANGNLKTRARAGTIDKYVFDSAGALKRIDRTDPVGATSHGYASYDYSGRRVFHQRVGESRKTYWITKHFEVTDLGHGQYQHTVYVPGPSGTLAAITKVGKGNTLAPATTGNSLESVNHAGLLGISGAFALLIFVLMNSFSSRAVLSFFRPISPAGHNTSRTFRWLYPVTTPIVLLSFLFSSITPAFANLTPGPNGIGVPTPGYSYFLPNHLESTVLVTDQAGNVTANVSYLPYGAIDQPGSQGTDNFRPKLTGAEWDPTSGLYHMGARYYAPDLGRFISPDPAKQYINPYLYAGNNPVTYIDPNGDFAFLVAMIIGAIVGAYFGGAAVNHDMNPLHWNWRSGKTYAGLFAGAAIGAVGAAAGGVAVEAGVALGASGGLAAEAAGTAMGIAGQTIVGAGENAAYTALGGGSPKEILDAAGQGAMFGAVFAAGGEMLSGVTARFARRATTLTETDSSLARRGSQEAEEGTGDFCGASFVGGTQVLLGNLELVPIETLKVGDDVAGRDLLQGKEGAYRIAELFEHEVEEVVIIRLSSGHMITTTPSHPFRAHKRGWIEAQYLIAGDQLESEGEDPVEVASVERRRLDNPVTVNNLEVDGVHNYFVGEDRILVHNPSKKGRTCTASIDTKTGLYTESWSESELNRRFPKKSEYQAVKRDIRAKHRNANRILKGGIVKASTRVGKKVRTASDMWVRSMWKQKYGTTLPKGYGVRKGLATIRPHFGLQDVDESLTRLHGGLTIREGMPENQMPMNAFANQTSGSAAGALARRVPPTPIFRFRAVFVKNL